MDLFAILKKKVRRRVLTVQKIVIGVSLFLLYFAGFGITFILTFLFNRKMLFPQKGQEDTYWLDVQDYEADISGCQRQS
jgi:hypothetical protein